MNRLQKRIVPVNLDGETLYLRPLSAKQRLAIAELHEEIAKVAEEKKFRAITEQMILPFVGKAIVDQDGKRIYDDDRIAEVLDDFTGAELDQLQARLLEISGMAKGVEETIKNSEPIPSASVQ